MTKYRDVSGRRFGRLVALRMDNIRPTKWLCQCDCGNQKSVLLSQINNGKTKSCGCIRREWAREVWSSQSRSWLMARAKYRIEKMSIPEPNSGCWLWTGALNNRGYGNTGFGKKHFMAAHRLSYMAFVGDPGDLNVLHKCDNPCCVNPDHLFLGTQQDNIDDCIAKGRFRPGGVSQSPKCNKNSPRGLATLLASSKLLLNEGEPTWVSD